jgi:hypothetical protein
MIKFSPVRFRSFMFRQLLSGCIAGKGLDYKRLAGSFPALPHYFSPCKSYSTSFEDCKRCKRSIPELETVAQSFKQRNLRQLTTKSHCRYLKTYQFKQPYDCELVNRIETVATEELRGFPDVIRIGNSRNVFLVALNKIPDGFFGDYTGDHGNQMQSFLSKYHDQELIGKIGSVIDIGGQNNATVKKVSGIFDNHLLPSLVVDPNVITPALSPIEANIHYVIEDAFSFFSSDSYYTDVKIFIKNQPTLFIMNNLLNVLKAEDGWKTLVAIWKRVRPGDYLAISGLVPEQIELHKFKKFHESNGIIEYNDRSNKFYKSAISSQFHKKIEDVLQDASVIVDERFTFFIMPGPNEVQGRRLLVTRKTP